MNVYKIVIVLHEEDVHLAYKQIDQINAYEYDDYVDPQMDMLITPQTQVS
jgi:hypothetical protein